MTKDIVNDVLELFSLAIEKATIDMKDFEITKRVYRKKLIKLFESHDKL